MLFLSDILTNVSFNWSALISGIWIYGIDIEKEYYNIRGSNLNWSLIPHYPNCQILNVFDYIEAKITPMIIEFQFCNNLNVEVLFQIEDKRKAAGRTLESNMLAYDGPTLRIKNFDDSQEVRAVMSLSQQINIEEDERSKCINYPNKQYKSYYECDQQFVYDYMRAMNLTPFWATTDLLSVTNQRSSKLKFCFSNIIHVQY